MALLCCHCFGPLVHLICPNAFCESTKTIQMFATVASSPRCVLFQRQSLLRFNLITFTKYRFYPESERISFTILLSLAHMHTSTHCFYYTYSMFKLRGGANTVGLMVLMRSKKPHFISKWIKRGRTWVWGGLTDVVYSLLYVWKRIWCMSALSKTEINVMV